MFGGQVSACLVVDILDDTTRDALKTLHKTGFMGKRSNSCFLVLYINEFSPKNHCLFYEGVFKDRHGFWCRNYPTCLYLQLCICG